MPDGPFLPPFELIAVELSLCAKIGAKWPDRLVTPGGAIHEMGGARMGFDLKNSVFNQWSQAHDAPNLFITDGAQMASNACQNPSLT